MHSVRSFVVPCAIAQWLSIYLSSSPLQDMIHHDASAVATQPPRLHSAHSKFLQFLFREFVFWYQFIFELKPLFLVNDYLAWCIGSHHHGCTVQVFEIFVTRVFFIHINANLLFLLNDYLAWCVDSCHIFFYKTIGKLFLGSWFWVCLLTWLQYFWSGCVYYSAWCVGSCHSHHGCTVQVFAISFPKVYFLKLLEFWYRDIFCFWLP